MKKNILKNIMALAVVVMPLVLAGCSNEDNFWTEAVTISGKGVVHHMATVEMGQSLQLKATTGILVSGSGFTWESSNPKIATIDENGLVTAINKGETTITAHTTGSSISYMGQITVYVINVGVGMVNDKLDQSEAQ